MIRRSSTHLSTATILSSILALSAMAFVFLASAAEKPAKLKAEDILSKHLEALGTAEARTKVNSRMVNGTVEFNAHSKAQVHLEGKAQVLS